MKKSKLMVRRQTIRVLSDDSLVRPQGGATGGCDSDQTCQTFGTNNYTLYVTCRGPSDGCDGLGEP